MKKNITNPSPELLISENRYDVLFAAFNILTYNRDWLVNLTDMGSRRSGRPEFGLNWWAAGTQTPEEGRKFKKQIEKVTKIADMLNGLNLVVDNMDDSIITSAEAADHYAEVLADVIYDYPDYLRFIELFLKADQDDTFGCPEDETFEPEEEHYTPSATAGDYSPSCPWKAPGMSISDFI